MTANQSGPPDGHGPGSNDVLPGGPADTAEMPNPPQFWRLERSVWSIANQLTDWEDICDA